jgi:DNA replication and repair protein RecF
MIITRLSIENFRIIQSAAIELGPGVNWFHGANGAGKTSVLEALSVLAKGRSFRSSTFGPIIGPEAESLRVVAATSGGMLGVERWAKQWRGRVDGAEVQRVAAFAQRMPIVLFEPSSHALVEGTPAVRRQYLDWTLFHVEHDYLSQWRRCMRDVRRRRALRAPHGYGLT